MKMKKVSSQVHGRFIFSFYDYLKEFLQTTTKHQWEVSMEKEISLSGGGDTHPVIHYKLSEYFVTAFKI